jgi:hypothetical protein
MKSNRKRNTARKAKSNRSQNPPTSNSGVRNSSPEAGSRGPKAGNGFVPQNQSTPDSDFQNSSPEAGHREPEASKGFVSQNRANAQHSTGPRTPEGKAASAQNAFKHGLSIQRHAVLRDEDPAQYAQLLSELREIYEPRSRREDLAVEDVAQCRWALQRFDEAEAISLQKLTDSYNDPVNFEGAEIIGAGESLALAAIVLTDVDEKDRSFVEPDETYPAFEKIHRYRTHWERKHTRALAEFDRAQRARHAEANQARAEAKEARAEAQAQRQAEAHALKQELALARSAQTANGFVSQNPPSPPYGVRNYPPDAGSREPEAGVLLAQLESLLNAPTPITEQEFLRFRAAQSTNGFVSQNPPSPNYGVRD